MRFSKPLKNESGMALVIVLVLAVAALIIMTSLIYMVTSGTETSGEGKRYSTALEAAIGGVDVGKAIVDSLGAPNLLNVNQSAINACINTKLTKPVSGWPAGCDSSFIINANAATTYDMSVTLGNYNVYAKIVDTVPGNTAQVQGLSKPGVVKADSGEATVPAKPYFYTIEALSQSQTNPSERSKVSGVYEY